MFKIYGNDYKKVGSFEPGTEIEYQVAFCAILKLTSTV